MSFDIEHDGDSVTVTVPGDTVIITSSGEHDNVDITLGFVGTAYIEINGSVGSGMVTVTGKPLTDERIDDTVSDLIPETAVTEDIRGVDVTVSNAFEVSSLGSGADGSPGYPLISVWITGRELKDAFEVDASVTGLMPAAQIYGAGMTWTWNPYRMLLNRVNDCAQVLPDGSTVPLEDDKLYRVVTGLYTGQMLGTVNDQSFGILTITPKDAQGNEVTDFEDQIIYTANGSELKEWYALASYLRSMGTVDSRYAAPEGRKVEEASLNPVSLF